MHDLELMRDYFSWRNAKFDVNGNPIENPKLRIFKNHDSAKTPHDFYHCGYWTIYSTMRFHTLLEANEYGEIYTDLVIRVPFGYVGKFVLSTGLDQTLSIDEMLLHYHQPIHFTLKVLNIMDCRIRLSKGRLLGYLYFYKVADNVSVSIVDRIDVV